MRSKKFVAALFAGLLLLGGAACEDNQTEETEDVTPELDEGSGEGGVVDEESGE